MKKAKKKVEGGTLTVPQLYQWMSEMESLAETVAFLTPGGRVPQEVVQHAKHLIGADIDLAEVRRNARKLDHYTIEPQQLLLQILILAKSAKSPRKLPRKYHPCSIPVRERLQTCTRFVADVHMRLKDEAIQAVSPCLEGGLSDARPADTESPVKGSGRKIHHRK